MADLPDYVREITITVNVPDIAIGSIKTAQHIEPLPEYQSGDKLLPSADSSGRLYVELSGVVPDYLNTAINVGAYVESLVELEAGQYTVLVTDKYGRARVVIDEGSITIPSTVTIEGSVSITGTVACIQSGTWTVAISGTVTVSGTVAISGTVACTQSGTWTVTISGTVAVTQSGTWTVAISGTVTVSGTVAISGTVACTQSGTWNIGTVTTITNTVTVTGSVTVSGTVTVNAGTNLNTSALALETTLTAIKDSAGIKKITDAIVLTEPIIIGARGKTPITRYNGAVEGSVSIYTVSAGKTFYLAGAWITCASIAIASTGVGILHYGVRSTSTTIFEIILQAQNSQQSASIGFPCPMPFPAGTEFLIYSNIAALYADGGIIGWEE